MSGTPQTPDIDHLIRNALALRDAGRGSEALDLLAPVLHRDPANFRLWQAIGTIHRALDQSTEAIAAFTRASRLRPGDLRARHGIAHASLEAGRPAATRFATLQAISPSDRSLALGRSAAQLAEGHGAAAVADLDRFVEADPLWLEGQGKLARLRWQLGDTAHFTDGYRRALMKYPADGGLWIGLINLLLEVERYDAATSALVEAHGRTGGDGRLLPIAATCASESGDVASADSIFNALAASTDVAIVEQHARHLLRCGRPEAAAARVEPLLSGPRGDRLWPYASLAWRLTGDPRAEWLEGDPALVGTYDLGLSATELTALGARLRTLHVARRDPLGQSVRGGTQTDGPLFAHEAAEIRRLRAAVVESVDQHIAAMGAGDPRHPTRRHIGKRFRFAGSWSVRLTGAGHHSSHIHPQGWLSSACYIALPPPEVMGPEPAGWLQLGQPPASLGLEVQPYRQIEPAPGQLVLFPSTMWHGTAPIAGGERLSVAFDVAAIG